MADDVQSKPTSVMIAVLTDGVMRREITQWLLVTVAQDHRYDLQIDFIYDQPVSSARNKATLNFLVTEHDYLLMVDQDQAISSQPLDLIEHDLDVVGLPTPILKVDGPPDQPIKFNIWLEDENGLRLGGMLNATRSPLLEVAGIGTGCMVIARRVLEHPDMRAPFADVWNPDGTRAKGEDLNFCQRARAAGFRVWAAMDHPCGHVKHVDLAHMQQLIAYAARTGGGPLTSPARALEGKRLIFVLSPGRCGTAYLAQALNSLPDVTAYHEPEPSFVHRLRIVQSDPGEAIRFWLDLKLPYIAQESCQVYAETSHLFAEGFAEALLTIGVIPDIVVLRRPHREVALSMWRRRAIPGCSDLGNRYHIIPTDVGLPFWEDLSDYQLCYWYCLEMEARCTHLAPQFAQRGGRVHETTMAEIVTREGMDALTDALALPRVAMLPGVVNANPGHLAGLLPDEDLDEAERDVTGRV